MVAVASSKRVSANSTSLDERGTGSRRRVGTRARRGGGVRPRSILSNVRLTLSTTNLTPNIKTVPSLLGTDVSTLEKS